MSSNEKRGKPALASEANNLVEAALKSLCENFIESPTLFLEEKHLHNEFDRILRKKIEDKINITATTNDDVEFPLIMNEYATVHHYSRDSWFEEPMDKKEKEGWGSGSLDYVWLWDEWVEGNSYCTAVNKDADFRRGDKGEGVEHDTTRYLVVVEFKFDHYAKYMATMDKKKNDDQGKPWQSSINSALKKMEEDLQHDRNKIVNEEPPFGHVVYFNSRIPLDKPGVKKVLKAVKESKGGEKRKRKENPPKEKGTKITLWYMQGGVETRFPSRSQKKDEFPLIVPPKK